MRNGWWFVAAVTACAACGDEPGTTPVVDAAASAVDAFVFVDASTTCNGGGTSAVTLDSGGGDPAQAFANAWFDRGNGGKACFSISIVLAPTSHIDFDVPLDSDYVEVWFGPEPVVGSNDVLVRLDGGTREFAGTVDITAFSEDSVTGTINAVDGATTVSGDVVADRCLAIGDPCI